MRKILAVLLFSVATISMAQEKVLLRLNYEKGAQYEMAMTMKQDMGVGVMDIMMKMGIEVTEVSEEFYKTQTKFTYISTNVLQGGVEKVNYNSEMKDEELSEEGKKFKSQIQPMLDAIIFSKVTKFGENKVEKVEPNIPGVNQFANQSNKTVVYPKEAVKVGSSWTNTQSNKEKSMEIVYKVTEITSNKVLADIVGKMSLMPTAKITGKIVIDKKTGIPLKTIMNIEMDMMGKKIKSSSVATMNRL